MDTQKTLIITDVVKNEKDGSPQILYREMEIMKQVDCKKLFNDKVLTRFADYTPSKKDKMYIFSGCNIPRFKLKDFHAEHGTKMVKYDNKSTVAFASLASVDRCFRRTGMQGYNKAWMITYFQKVLGVNDPRYNKFLQDLDSIDASFIGIDYSAKSALEGQEFFHLKPFKDWREESKYRDYQYHTEFKEGDVSKVLIEKMINHPVVYDETALLQHLGSGTVLDLDAYENLTRLFESSDRQNASVGMELMANANFDESAVYLLLLVHQYGGKMYESGNRNHVNFKSLLTYFNIRDIQYYKIDNVVDSLKSKDLLTPENINVLIPLVRNQLNKEKRVSSFTIESISFDGDENAPRDKDELFDEINPHL